MNTDFEMVAKTLYGFEELLENELKQLGAKHIEKEYVMFDLLEIRGLCINVI